MWQIDDTQTKYKNYDQVFALVDDKDIYQTHMRSQAQNFEHSEGLAAEVQMEFNPKYASPPTHQEKSSENAGFSEKNEFRLQEYLFL